MDWGKNGKRPYALDPQFPAGGTDAGRRYRRFTGSDADGSAADQRKGGFSWEEAAV